MILLGTIAPVARGTAGDRLAAALERGDLEAIASLYAEDAVMYHPLMPQGVHGREAICESEADLLRAFGDIRIEVRSVLETRRGSAAQVVLRAVNDGPLDIGGEEPLPPTGRRIELPSVWWFELDEHGLVTEERDYFDSAGLMSQLGLDAGEAS